MATDPINPRRTNPPRAARNASTSTQPNPASRTFKKRKRAIRSEPSEEVEVSERDESVGGYSLTAQEIISLRSKDSGSPGSAILRLTQLETRGITLVDIKETEDPHKHFKTKPCDPKFYTSLKLPIDKEPIGSRVFIDLDKSSFKAFAKELEVASKESQIEAWYQNHYLHGLLEADPRHHDSQKSERLSRRVVQEIQASIRPREAIRYMWTEPPLLKEAHHLLAAHGIETLPTYSWDIRPDVQYWLSTTNFPLTHGRKRGYRSLVREVISAPHSRTSPYVTCEFKAAKAIDERKAINQVMAAGGLALWNRCDVRVTRLKKQNLQWTARDTEVLKHYAVVIFGHEVFFYCITLKPQAYYPINSTDWEWTGCEMRLLNSYQIDQPHDLLPLERVQKWINEIHRWGFFEHFMELRKDVCTMIDMRAKESSEGAEEGYVGEEGLVDGGGSSEEEAEEEDTSETSIDLAGDPHESARTQNVAR